MFRVDELLLLENLTYLEDIPPLLNISNFVGKTIKEMFDLMDLTQIDDEKDYSSFTTGYDWKNLIYAILKNKKLCETKIIDSHFDMAFGGGLGLSILFINEEEKESVVAYRGTAAMEWTDDFLGANQIDSLQQINALEWYKFIYQQFELKNYYITVIGHSKGGNKAKYIAILNNTVDRCVSFDGQGFSDKFINYYKKEILSRQNIIQNHNIDYDFVNILMNDIGSQTFYVGFGYGAGGFAESHCPNTFFSFDDDKNYKMEINPNGQRPEMQILKGFINSLIRSAETDKDRSKNNKLVGELVEKGFSVNKEISQEDFINFLFNLIGDEDYIDNAAYVLAFTIKYSKQNPNFLISLKDIMNHFDAKEIVKTIEIIEDLVNSKKLNIILGVSNFLISHVNKIVVKKIQSMLIKKYEVNLTKEQISKALIVVSLTKEKLKTLELDLNGKNIDLDTLDINEIDEDIENLNIVVLAGGLSIERNISLHNGYMIYKELKDLGHNVILLDSYMGYNDEEIKINDAFKNPDKYSLDIGEIPESLPDLWAVRKRRIYQTDSYFGPNVLQICKQSDLVFIALNGTDGENGKIQATFDLLGIDYTGNDYLSSFKATNKIISKSILKENNIKTPKWYSLKKGDEIIYPNKYNFSYPLIVKTNTLGYGVGIKAVINDDELNKAIIEAFKWDDEIIIEEYIIGREFSCSTINLTPLPVLEILPLNTKDELIGMNLRGIKSKRCPAEIEKELENKLQEISLKASSILNLKAYSKINFIIKNDDIYCIKCDSLPELGCYSHFAAEAKEANILYKDLINMILKNSL